jgi:two-component system OmpR family sensor kinase
MSLLTKVSILFLASLSLMFYVSKKVDSLTQQSMESLLKEKYILTSRTLFPFLGSGDLERLEQEFQVRGFSLLTKAPKLPKGTRTLYRHQGEFSDIKVFRLPQSGYLLYMRYLDDTIWAKDTTQEKILQEIEKLDYFILADVLILVILFLLILGLIYPVRKISEGLKAFGEGDYRSRIKINSQDEIGKLAHTFNTMAERTESLIRSRQTLLRNVGHELRTPISRSKFALEMLEEGRYTKLLKEAVTQMDTLTAELLDLERIHAMQDLFHKEPIRAETIILLALERLFLEDEHAVNVTIDENFTLEGDKRYLSIALKNLIDNALKYADTLPVEIIAKHRSITVRNRSDALKHPLNYYCDAFTQGDTSRQTEGYGLGLNMVQTILEKHGYTLHYIHQGGHNLFTIQF